MASKAAKEYYSRHWKIPHSEEIEWRDTELDDHLKATSQKGRHPEVAEWGRLVGFQFIPEGRDGRQRKGKEVQLSRADSNGSHLVYDPHHRHQRMYLLLSPSVRKQMKKKFWSSSPYAEEPLSWWAKEAGGRHGKKDYPAVEARLVGTLTHLDYACEKKGDGYSFYRHAMGEESGIQPLLVVDAKGRLWIVGGNYTGPIPGITD